jgi:hypothetical protein
MPELNPEQINLLKPAIGALDQQNGMLGFVHDHYMHPPAGAPQDTMAMLRNDVVIEYLAAAKIVDRQTQLGTFVENCGTIVLTGQIDRTSEAYKNAAKYAGVKLRDTEATAQLDTVVKHFGAPKNVKAFGRLYGRVILNKTAAKTKATVNDVAEPLQVSEETTAVEPLPETIAEEVFIEIPETAHESAAVTPDSIIVSMPVVLRTIETAETNEPLNAETLGIFVDELETYAGLVLSNSGGVVKLNLLSRELEAATGYAITRKEAADAVRNIIRADRGKLFNGTPDNGSHVVSNQPVFELAIRPETPATPAPVEDFSLRLSDRPIAEILFKALTANPGHWEKGLDMPALVAATGIDEDQLRGFVNKFARNGLVERRETKFKGMRFRLADHKTFKAYQNGPTAFFDEVFSDTTDKTEQL